MKSKELYMSTSQIASELNIDRATVYKFEWVKKNIVTNRGVEIDIAKKYIQEFKKNQQISRTSKPLNNVSSY
jgi:predicted transcriptional regulator